MTTRAARERGNGRGGTRDGGVGVGAGAGPDGGPGAAEPVRTWTLAWGPAPGVSAAKRMESLRWAWTGEQNGEGVCAGGGEMRPIPPSTTFTLILLSSRSFIQAAAPP